MKPGQETNRPPSQLPAWLNGDAPWWVRSVDER